MWLLKWLGKAAAEGAEGPATTYSNKNIIFKEQINYSQHSYTDILTNSRYSLVYEFGNYTCYANFLPVENISLTRSRGPLSGRASLLRPLIIFNFSFAKNIKCTMFIFRLLFRINQMKKRYWTKSPNRHRIARNQRSISPWQKNRWSPRVKFSLVLHRIVSRS